jgi:hypothetical protein
MTKRNSTASRPAARPSRRRNSPPPAEPVIDLTRDYTTKEAAPFLDISERRVRALCQDGRLGRRVGGRMFLIGGSELRTFRQQTRKPGNPNFGPNFHKK